MIKELIEALTGLHFHKWKYFGYEYFRRYYSPDGELPTKRKCRCGKKQKQIFSFNQEGETNGSEWIDDSE